MKKEIIIICIILILVVLGDIFSQKYTEKSVEFMNEKIDALGEELLNQNKDDKKIDEKYDDTLDTWEERFKVLAYYLEHDELEKVKTELIILRANMEVGEYEKGFEEIEKCKYILEHIEEKESFSIMNIF